MTYAFENSTYTQIRDHFFLLHSYAFMKYIKFHNHCYRVYYLRQPLRIATCQGIWEL